MRRLVVAPLAALSLLLPFGASAPTTAAPAYPTLSVTTVVGGLATPWDVQELPGGDLLYDERDTGTLSVWDGTVAHRITAPGSWHGSESGMLGLAVDRDFADNRRFYLCRGVQVGGGRHAIHVEAWTMDPAHTDATLTQKLIMGIQATSGRHGGCRLLIGTGGYLYVGTGDAANWRNPQRKYSLNGKVLRLDPATGEPAATNPWIHSSIRTKQYVYNYGHRNVQGLAQRADGRVWSVEHGSYRDDEINLLEPGANYGWNPGPRNGYDESGPMTDYRLPGRQHGAQWSSGNPTIATSGASWVQSSSQHDWGAYDGMLAVGVLKDQRLQFFRFSASGRYEATHIPSVLNGDEGRLRSVTRASDGSLLVTTSNGTGDKILRVTPTS